MFQAICFGSSLLIGIVRAMGFCRDPPIVIVRKNYFWSVVPIGIVQTIGFCLNQLIGEPTNRNSEGNIHLVLSINCYYCPFNRFLLHNRLLVLQFTEPIPPVYSGTYPYNFNIPLIFFRFSKYYCCSICCIQYSSHSLSSSGPR